VKVDRYTPAGMQVGPETSNLPILRHFRARKFANAQKTRRSIVIYGYRHKLLSTLECMRPMLSG